MSAINKIYDPNNSVHYDLNDTRFITSVADLGLTAGSCTIAQVYAAMNNGDVAVIQASQVTDTSTWNGIHIFFKGTSGLIKHIEGNNGTNFNMYIVNGTPTGTWVSERIGNGIYFQTTQPSDTHLGAIWFKPKE